MRIALRGAFSAIVALILVLSGARATGLGQDTLPGALSDREFWSLTEKLSEPDRSFRSFSGSSDNLLSNESETSSVAAALAERVKPSGVYLGVGPEQNFTYIAAIRPRIAFITDIRRGNLHLHLMYKALFEMSANRADFTARLFSRKQPPGLTTASTAAELMTAYLAADPVDDAGFRANLKSLSDYLTRERSFPIDTYDLAGIEYVYKNFHRFGPGIRYGSSSGSDYYANVTYATLMAATGDATGAQRSYIASEDAFAFVKSMQNKNLIVPIVGDFAGPRALRAVGAFLKDRGVTVTAFYLSNVETYLTWNNSGPAFCANVAAMPLDDASTFVRLGAGRYPWFGAIAAETARCGTPAGSR
jgi:hypothetical protein